MDDIQNTDNIETDSVADVDEALENQEDVVQEENKKHSRIWLVILLIFIVILFLLSSVLLGSRLYEMATRDQYTVDMEIGEPGTGGELEIFRIEYKNDTGDITVKGVNAEKVVAPGTTVDYDIHLKNKDDVIIDFLMNPIVEYLTDDEVPIEFRIVDEYGNYIIGSDSTWANAESMNELVHKGSIHPGEVYTYHLSWRWVFEIDDEHNAYDTYLGNQGGKILPGIKVGIETQSSANPMPPRSNSHMMHLFGEDFGCCWCCYLVWILLFVILLLAIWIWRLRRKLEKYEEMLDEKPEEEDNLSEDQEDVTDEQGAASDE